MSIDSMSGLLPSAAGVPRAQVAGADAQGAATRAAALLRERSLKQLADRSAGVAQPDGRNLLTEDRDANGRQGWQYARGGRELSQPPSPAAAPTAGECGKSIDLVG